MAWFVVSLGYRVKTAHCVQAVLELVTRKAIDVLLAEIGLPGGSGLEMM